MNIYVGNLAYGVSEDDLKEAFGAFGEVISVKLIKDKFTGDSKGFGFVEMATKEAGEEAINSLNGADMKGRNIVVNEARPREDRGGERRGGGGGERRGGGGGNRDRRGGGDKNRRW